jgi:predicted ATPase/class 3 adenylate cyclase
MSDLPSGTVTFLFTDIEGSTRMWEEHPDAMRSALARHDEVLQSVAAHHDGSIFSRMGDGMAMAFASAGAAVTAAVAIQEQLFGEPWPTGLGRLLVRMGVHTGDALVVDGQYLNPPLNRCARLMAIGHGGQVLISGSTESLVHGVLPEGVELVDLGDQRLRDLSEPLRVFEVHSPGLPRAFPPLRSLSSYPGNLPVQLTSFVGRELELKQLSDILVDQRLVTLTGTGGVGKTRLALQLAADGAPSFPAGVWLCELGPASDPVSMLGQVGAALGSVPRNTSPVDGLADFIGDRRLLLILDNCEHLLDATADLAERLLLACREAKILATSREALDVAGERVVRIRSLELPHVAATVEELTQVASSRLFLERAEAAGASLRLGSDDRRAVAEVCRRLDGIPLAIELAAARTIAMSPSEVAVLLDERFRLLTGGRRASVERHQNLRATIDWSYSLLSPAEQRVFNCLGVFPASFDADAAQAVSADDGIDAWDVVDAVTSLVAKSMITAEHGRQSATRYQMLESLRHYARDHLGHDSTADEVRRRHARHFADFAEQFRGAFIRGEETAWNAKLDLEFDNLRSAVLWSLESKDSADGDLALRILASSAIGAGAMVSSGLYQLAAQATERVRRGDPRYRSVILAGASLDAFYRGDLEQAIALSHEALAEGLGADSLGAEGALLVRLMFASGPEVPKLITEGQEQLEAFGASDWQVGQYLASAASMAYVRGHVDVARVRSAEALERAAALNSEMITANASFAYGMARWQSEPEAALEVMERNLAAILSLPHEPLADRALALMAQLRCDRGDSAKAMEHLGAAITRAHASSDRQGMATVLARGVFVLAAAERETTAVSIVGAVTEGVLKGLRPLPPQEMPGFDQTVRSLRASLGPLRFEEVMRNGSAMPYNEVVTLAIDAVRQDAPGAVSV